MIKFKRSGCPICSSNEFKKIGRPKVIDQVFKRLNESILIDSEIVKCNKCSHYYIDPLPYFSDTLLNEMYSSDNNYFNTLTDQMRKIINYASPKRRLNSAGKILNKKDVKFLEIGCGEGFGLKAAKEMGWDVYGQDISSDFALLVKNNTGINIQVGKLTDTSYKKESFDIIYLDSVLEHVSEPLEFLSLITTFLSSKGLIYIILPNENSIPNALIDFINNLKGRNITSRMMPFSNPYHIQGFSKRSIVALSDEIGLEVKSLKCKYSYNHLIRYKNQLTMIQKFRKKIVGNIHIVSDLLNCGMNMEVMLTKN